MVLFSNKLAAGTRFQEKIRGPRSPNLFMKKHVLVIIVFIRFNAKSLTITAIFDSCNLMNSSVPV